MTSEKISKASLGHVLITGGCGFLGGNIVSLLLLRYPKSTVSVIDIRTKLNRIESPKVSYHNCDITDLSAVRDVFQKIKPDVVIHTAATVPSGLITDAVMYKVNVDGTKNLLAAAQELDTKAFIYTSSASVVVGHVDEVIRADESWPVMVGKDQPEYYSNTKGIAERLVLEANRSSSGFLSCSIRPAGIFGVGDTLTLWRMLLIRGFKARFQLGSNDNLFDFTYVKNVAHSHLLAAEALLQTRALGTIPLDTERVDGEAFFVTNGTPVYFWDFMRQVLKESGREPKALELKNIFVLGTGIAMVLAILAEIVMGLVGKSPNFSRVAVRSSSMTRYFSIDKARTRLRYEPIVSLEEGIRLGVEDVLARQAKLGI